MYVVGPTPLFATTAAFGLLTVAIFISPVSKWTSSLLYEVVICI
jgi:hypothetical protein